MVRRSSLIFAAALAVFSTLDSAYCIADPAAEIAKHEVQKPRFMKKNVKRYYGNSTGGYPGQPGVPVVADGAGRNRFAAINNLDQLEEEDKSSSSTTHSFTSSSATSSSTTSSTTPDSADIVTPAPIAPIVGDGKKGKDEINEKNGSPTNSKTSSTSTKEPIIKEPAVGGTEGKAKVDNPGDLDVIPGSATSSSISISVNKVQQGQTTPPINAGSQSTSTPPLVVPAVGNQGGKKAEVGGGGKTPTTSPTSPTSPPAPNSTPKGDGATEPNEGSGNGESKSSSSPTVVDSTKPSKIVGGVGGALNEVNPIVNSPSASKSKEDTLPSNPADTIDGVVGGVKDVDNTPKASQSVVGGVVGGVKDVDNTPKASQSVVGTIPSKVGDTVGAVVDQGQNPSASRDRFQAGSSATESPNPQISVPVGGTTGKQVDTNKGDTNELNPGGNINSNSKINLSIQSDGALAPIVASPEPSSSPSKAAVVPGQGVLDTNSLPAQIPASITSGGKLIPNPAASGKPGDTVGKVVDQAGNVVSDVLGAGKQSLSVIAGGVLSPSGPSGVKDVVVNPSGDKIIPPASVVLNNGEKVVNPSLLAASPGVTQPPSVTLDNGSVVPNPALITSSPEQSGKGKPPVLDDSTGSTTLPNGQVVPIQSVPATPIDNNSTDNNIPVVPGKEVKGQNSQSGVVLPLGGASVTLPNGEVVPPSAVPSQVKPGQFFERPKANAGESVSAEAGQPKGSQSVPTAPPQAPGSAAGQKPATAASIGAPGAPASGSQPPPGPTAGPVATSPQKYHVEGNAPISQQPIGYDQNTVLKVDSSITFESSSPPATTGTETLPTGIPTGVPLVLYPPTGKARQPSNTVLIQIGFLFPLNYDFVWTHDQSQRQIFTYLPLGVAYCLGVERVNVTMQTLRAWDTTQDLHYITTLALMWIPATLVNDIDLAVRQPFGNFYNQPDPSIKTLLSMVNNAIPIRADNMDGSGTETDGNNSGPAATSDTAPVGGNIGSSSPVKASSVGIGVGVVCGAAAYGAAMFFVARRYKKRRQNHLRSPSMFSSPVMSHAGGDPAAGQALMSGAVGGERSVSPYYDRAESRGSARSGGSSGRQQISAPVMAENSLGWN